MAGTEAARLAPVEGRHGPSNLRRNVSCDKTATLHLMQGRDDSFMERG